MTELESPPTADVRPRTAAPNRVTATRGPDAAAGGAILTVTGLTVRYGRRIGLEDVTFALDRGARVAVVGPNGSGKSTLFRALAGIVAPAGGEIVIHDHAPGVDACVAYVQQRFGVDWKFPITVFEVVMQGRTAQIGLLRRSGRYDRIRVVEALATVGLSDRADRRIDELSGGEQQRMFIARALAQEAELILLDEPFSGLDSESRRRVLAALDALRADGVAVMVATHDLDLASRHFDEVMLLNRRLVGFGAPERVLTEPHLRLAYGGALHVVAGADGQLALGDTCCEGGPHEPH